MLRPAQLLEKRLGIERLVQKRESGGLHFADAIG